MTVPGQADSSSTGPQRRPPPYDWIHRMALPVWVTAPDRTIHDANAQAVEVLALTGRPFRGEPCHDVVGGCATSGAPLCGPRCAVQETTRSGQTLAPVVMRVHHGRGCWLEVITVPSHDADAGLFLIHCGRRIDAERRVQVLLHRIATRSTACPRPCSVLSARERDVLTRLAHGDPPATIARALFVSRATVRNHTQHILAKLGVHSTLEAIAVHLLAGPGAGADG